MIYFCADDYGLCSDASMRIKECVDCGGLNKFSVYPNLDSVDMDEFLNKNIRLSLHLNLVEGRCMAEPYEVDLLADEKGNFRHTFFGLFKLWLFKNKKLEEQLYREIRAQVLYWKNILPDGASFCIDSHQHTHMIPAVFKTLIKVLREENISLKYMRIPAEPVMPYIKTPSLYFTYSPVNIIKQWLLKFLWIIDKNKARGVEIPTALFMGILFSGRMDEKRVRKVLPKYKNLADKKGMDIEVLFHPGFLDKEIDFENKNIVFSKFYISENRKTEFDSVMNIKERSVG